MPEGLAWKEVPSSSAMTIEFDGPGAPTARAWAGVVATVTSAFFIKLVYSAPAPNPVWVKAIPIVLLVAGISLVIQAFPGAHKGRVEVDGVRLQVVPSSPFAVEVTVPLDDIDYFTSNTEQSDYQSTVAGSSTLRVEMRFRVFVYRRSGQRHTLAMFGEASPASFMAQRLEGLVERARAGRFG